MRTVSDTRENTEVNSPDIVPQVLNENEAQPSIMHEPKAPPHVHEPTTLRHPTRECTIPKYLKEYVT